jgi:hypothetical protein
MKIAVYNSVNGSAPAIAWWLASDNRYGPQLYDFEWREANDNKNIGGIVIEDRDNRIVSEKVYNLHQESLRRMENLDANEQVSDCVSPFNEIENDYDICVWSNYFGCLKDTSTVINVDKTIINNTSAQEFQFFYISQYAFNTISHQHVDSHTNLWWQDHMLMNGSNIGKWKSVWYDQYHDYMHTQIDSGFLKYMWQLNFAHWDLYHAQASGSNDITLTDDPARLFGKFQEDNDADDINYTIKTYEQLNKSHIIVGDDWFKQPDYILDYLEISSSSVLDEKLKIYIDKYNSKKEQFNHVFKQYI